MKWLSVIFLFPILFLVGCAAPMLKIIASEPDAKIYVDRPGPRQTGLNEGLNCVDLA